MTPTKLECSVEYSEEGIAGLLPIGSIDLKTTLQSPLFSAAQQAASGPAATVLFDFNQARIDDGFGLAHLLALAIKLKKKGLTVAACNLGRQSTGLLRELGFERLFHFFETRESALTGLRTTGPGTPATTNCSQENSSYHELLPTGFWPAVLGPTLIKNDIAGPQPLNLPGRMVQGPGAGFGSLWQKTYKVRLVSQKLATTEVAARLKSSLPEYWPAGNYITLPDGLNTGAPGIIDLRLPGGLPLSTGIRVLNVSTEAFSFVPVQGHMEAGWISFGVCEEDGYPTVVVQSLARTGDPFYELGFDIFGHRQQEEFWDQTLSALGLDFGEKALVEVAACCLENRKNWRGWNNFWWNAGIRTLLGRAGRRLRQLRQSETGAEA